MGQECSGLGEVGRHAEAKGDKLEGGGRHAQAKVDRVEGIGRHAEAKGDKLEGVGREAAALASGGDEERYEGTI
eukprot:361704-Chlamydomonas_euryale.AAC.2